MLVLLAVFLAAAVVGDQVGFTIGRAFGARLFARPDSRLSRREHADRAAAFFRRHGGVAVVAGAALWVAGMVGVGCLFGGISVVAAHIELITIAVAGLSAVPLAAELMRRRRVVVAPASHAAIHELDRDRDTVELPVEPTLGTVSVASPGNEARSSLVLEAPPAEGCRLARSCRTAQ